MRKIMSIWRIAVLLGLLTVTSAGGDAPTVVIAEGTQFSPRDDQGWRIVHQDDSWASHSYGEVKSFCEQYGKPLVRLPAGYSPNQVAAQILRQSSEQLENGS